MRKALFLGAGLASSLPLLATFYTASSLSACSSSDTGDSGADVDQRPPTPPEWDRPVTRPDDTTAANSRAACTYKRGDMPAETLGASEPVDTAIPIDTVVVLMMENHSFDNYFGQLGKFLNRTDIESAPANATNPGVDPGDGGAPAQYPYTHAPHKCTLDTNHEWNGSHYEYADGGMSGFVQQNEGWSAGDLPDGGDPSLASGARAMYYYDQTDIPFYYALAQNFAIGDHYHCSVIGPTWVNRMYFWAGTSFGRTSNEFPDITSYTFPDNDATILDELEKRHVDWNIYANSLPSAAMIYGVSFLNRWGRNPQHRVTPYPNTPSDGTDFVSAAKAGTLPPMSFLDPDLIHENSDGNDEHPPGDIQTGQKFTSDMLQALMTGPQWPHMAIFITWDEHGGFYDHYAPPPACVPDTTAPILSGSDNSIPANFDRLGFRVPLIVVSPYAKKGYVGHATYDHTSITKFIEAKFKIPCLTARDANADAPMDLFDFSAPTQLTPPTLPAATIDPTELTYCETTYPHGDGGL